MTFDEKKYHKTHNALDGLNKTQEVLESLLSDTQYKISEVKAQCTHDLVITYRHVPAKIGEFHYAYCPICDTFLTLCEKETSYEMLGTEATLSKESVLDITEDISEKMRTEMNNEVVCLKVARTALEDLIDKNYDWDYTLEEIKGIVLNSLKELDNHKEKGAQRVKK